MVQPHLGKCFEGTETPYQYIIRHPLNPLCQPILSTHPINTPYQHTLSIHCQYTLSTHLINTPWYLLNYITAVLTLINYLLYPGINKVTFEPDAKITQIISAEGEIIQVLPPHTRSTHSYHNNALSLHPSPYSNTDYSRNNLNLPYPNPNPHPNHSDGQGGRS